MAIIKIDLSAMGEGQYVEMRDPKFLSWGVQKSITALVMDDAKTSAQLDVAERIAIAMIKTGFVLGEDDVQVVFPLTVETIKDCPAAVIEAVTLKFSEMKKVETDRKN